MPFKKKPQTFSAAIKPVELGTGAKATVIGGENVLPFYTFDAPIANAPKIGMEISDTMMENAPARLKAFYAGCETMADMAKKDPAFRQKMLGALQGAGLDGWAPGPGAGGRRARR